jgi:hypothetical protein
MPEQENRTPTPSIDLGRVTEETRRALYDAVVAVHFTPTYDELQGAVRDPDNHWVPAYGPDEARLAVFYLYGRWVAVWRALDEPEDAPEEQRWTVLRIGPSGDGSGGVIFFEV